jgi:hypothetical protein
MLWWKDSTSGSVGDGLETVPGTIRGPSVVRGLEPVVVDHFRWNIVGGFVAGSSRSIRVVELRWLSGWLWIFSGRFVGHFALLVLALQ